jgi:uncharacterized repeat protein (TIGR02543 family)
MIKTIRKKITVLLIMSMLMQLLVGVAPVIAEDSGGHIAAPEFVPLLAVVLSPGEIPGTTSATVTGYVYGNLLVNITEQEIATPRVGDAVPTDGDNLIADYEPGADIAAGVTAGNYLQIYDVDMQEGARIAAFFQAKLEEKDIKESMKEGPIVEPKEETIGETAADQDEDPAEEMEDGVGPIEKDKPAEAVMGPGMAPMSAGSVIGTYTLGTNVTGTLYSDGELVISGTGPMTDYSNVSLSPFNSDLNSIKSVVITPGVTTIGNYMFNKCLYLTSVAIPDSVTNIGAHTFQDCTSLGTINIPNSIKSIGISAFLRCTSLATINIPNSVTSIGVSAFEGTSLASVTIPNSVTRIEMATFLNCSSLTSATIPAITSIGQWAFQGCSKLTTLSLSATPPTVEGIAFQSCPANRSLIIVDSTGAAVTGTALTSARQAYRAVDDGNTGDNYWYGWTIAQPVTPTAADFTYNFSTSPTYTGSPQAVTVTTSKPGMGSITVKYNGSTTAPVNAGTYSITIDVAEGESYTALNGLSLGTYTIKKATPVVAGTAQAITNVEPGINITALTGITVNGVSGSLGGSWQGTAPADYNTTQNVTMTFIPADTTNYNNVTTTVSVTTKRTYTVTFNANGGTGAPPTQAATPEKVTFKLPDNPFVKNGYYFAGWYDGTTLYSPSAFYTMPARDTTFTARWNVRSYNITYELDGGTSGANPTSYNIETPTITLKNATKTGYSFAGWFDAATEGNKVMSIPQGSTGDKALYARWTPNTNTAYQVLHYQQNVSGAGYTLKDTDNLSGTTTTTVNASAKAYTGFNENSSHTDRVASGSIAADGSLILKLYYDRNTHTVSFASNGGDAVADITGVRYGATIPAPAAPGRTGYTFAGWYKEAGLTSAWGFTTDTVTANMTLYVKWTVNQYTITFNSNGGSNVAPITQDYGTAVTKPANPTRAGYTFKAWSPALTATMPAANTTLAAQWDLVTYSITYHLDGGTGGANPTSYNIESAAFTLGNATKTGYTFAGWFDAATGGNKVMSIPQGSTGDKALYARWTPNNYTVTFNANGGGTPSPASKVVTYDGAYGELAAVTRVDYNLKGWFTAESGGVEITNATIVKATSDQTLYAQWEKKIELTITANSDSKVYDGTELTNAGWELTSGTLATGDSLEVTVAGSITDAGTAANAVTLVKIMRGTTDVTEYYKIDKVNGQLQITKRPVTLTSASASKIYDGAPLTKPEVTITGEGFVAGEATASATGSVTKVGSVVNIIIISKSAGYKDMNYAITWHHGDLKITKNTAPIVITADSGTWIYDGQLHSKDTFQATGLPDGFETEAVITGDITDFGTANNIVTSYVIKLGEEDVTNQFSNITTHNGTLEITKRPVTLTSASASKIYDGAPLTKPEVTITGEGFVAGEATASATGSVTKVGSVVNIIIISKSAGYKDMNYAITWHHGDLKITKNTAPIVITADSGTWIYDGQLHSKDTFQATGLPDGFETEAVITGDITDFGTANNIVTSYVIKLGEEDVTNQFSNITTHDGTLEITARPLGITAASNSKTYDGTELTNAGYSITSGSLADNQTLVSVKVTGSQLYAGISANAASEAVIKDASDNDVTGNYEITYIGGTLEVAKAEIKITVTANSDSKVYDGTELTNVGWDQTSGTLATGDSLQVTVAGSITDAGTDENVVTEVKVMHDTTDVTENYNITIQNGILAVTARPLEITAASASKTYDGTPLTNAVYSITAGSLATGQTLDSVTVTGSQTDPGSSANTASGAVIRDIGGNDVTGNYDITYIGGTLVINKRKDGGGGSGENPAPSQPTREGVDIFVNGKAETAATATTTQEGDKTVTSVTVNDKKVEERLAQEGNKAILTIPVKNGSDVVIGTLNGQTIKNMEDMEAVLEIKTENVTYTIPASQVNIDAVSAQFGEQIKLKDIAVSVKISEPAADTAKIVEVTADKNSYQIMVKPIEFEITCSRGDKTVEVSKFNAYVERLIEIPEGIDPSKITTGIILNADGTFSHVPTVITIIDGKYYAKINSLTNSVYSVIYSPKTFKDVEKHWANELVNDMASRLVVSGVGEDKFEPDRDITRAEFAAIAVRALGLMRPGTGKDVFNDVSEDAWYYDAVAIAYEYDLIAGYGNGQFGPMDKMVLYHRDL